MTNLFLIYFVLQEGKDGNEPAQWISLYLHCYVKPEQNWWTLYRIVCKVTVAILLTLAGETDAISGMKFVSFLSSSLHQWLVLAFELTSLVSCPVLSCFFVLSPCLLLCLMCMLLSSAAFWHLLSAITWSGNWVDSLGLKFPFSSTFLHHYHPSLSFVTFFYPLSFICNLAPLVLLPYLFYWYFYTIQFIQYFPVCLTSCFSLWSFPSTQ